MSTKPMTENPSLATPHNEQPASEWASTTLSALDPTDDPSHPPEAQSLPETPGVSMPGSFPTGSPIQRLMVPDVQYVQEVATDAFKTAKQYAQNAAQGAQTAALTAGEKVGQYIPSSVASYLSSEPGENQRDNLTLPSQETSPSSSGGVGTLPGTPGEIGVAVLPDERTGGISVDQSVQGNSVASSDVTQTSPIMTTTNNNLLGHPLEKNISSTLHDGTNHAKLPPLECLQSDDDEVSGRLGDQSGVALLPDERKEAQGGPTQIDGGASTDRTLPGSGYATSPLSQNHLVPQTTGREQPFSGTEEKLCKDHDAAETDEKTLPTNSLAEEAADAGKITATPKKSGFIHKVKGEMKILSGKMSHNESKIEEGRRMMGKN